MSKKFFSELEVNKLKKNKYVANVSEKAITYTNEFKIQFIADSNNGMSSKDIFLKAGFDIDVIGLKRVESSGSRWRKAYATKGITGLDDTRRTSSGRPRKKAITDKELLKKQEAEIAYLKAEIDLLKKFELSERGVKESKLTSSAIYKSIEVLSNKFSKSISYLCSMAGVSRSGYYNYLNSFETRLIREESDLKSRDIILKVFNHRGFKKGSRTIKMILENKFNIIFNRKKIQRIMRKYDIICPIRRANPYKRLAKATKEHRTVSNLLNRKFKQGIPGKVLLTDITYLPYKNNSMAYLSTIKDSSTNEILAYNISNSLHIDLVLDTVKILFKKIDFKLPEGAFIHSDQGSHYTSPKFQKLIKKYKIGQSMSRRGNCWDNAPQESFFGHMKDEIDYKNCETLDELKKLVRGYMNYYNEERCQYELKKLTPKQFRNQLLAA